MGQLVEVFWPADILQAVLAEVDQARPLGQGVANQRTGRLGQEDLATVAGGHDPGGPIDGWPEEVAATLLGLPAMEADPHVERAGLGPWLGA